MQYFDVNAIVDSLTPNDVIKICTDLGSEGVRRGSKGELIFQTICHGGHSYKLYYYHEPSGNYPGRIFHCYTGCADSFGIFELVIRVNRSQGKNISWYRAVSYVANMTNNLIYSSHTASKKHLIDDFTWINKLKATNGSETEEFAPINENILDMFNYTPHEEFLNAGISSEALSQFEISYWGLTNQIVIPHRDYRQQLIGIRGRYLDQEDVDAIGKYVPLNIEGKWLSHKLSNNLYGIHINQDKIKSCKKVLLVEGEKSVMQNHTYFGDDDFSLAVCGSEISTNQIRILLEYLGVEEVVLAFDKEYDDPEALTADIYRNKLYKLIAPLIPYCRVCILWDKLNLLSQKDSPTDRGKDTLLKLLDNKIEITLDDLAVLDESVMEDYDIEQIDDDEESEEDNYDDC